MSRALHKLTARTVATLSKPGRYSDGGGLFLVVSGSGARKWVFRFRLPGKRHDMGLGSAQEITLARARQLAAAARSSLAEGINPLTARIKTTTPSFGEMSDGVIKALSPSWRNEKHIAQWKMTLEVYAAPLRRLQVDEVTTDHVLAVLQPIWNRRPETASRLRGRIEKVLDAAKAKGHRQGENPARWRGHLDHLLPARQRLTRGHHAAMAYIEVPELASNLQHRGGVTALALEFLILTAARSGEVIGARWDEIDLDHAIWTVPALKMKAGREHRVPLTDRALEILAAMRMLGNEGFVFPGKKQDQPLSTMAMAMALRRMTVKHVTVHGFRSSFRDWSAEQTNSAREVAEAALAHVVSDRVEAAYRRTDLFDKRRELMSVWAKFIQPDVAAEIIPLDAQATA
jgi:integrase